MTAHKPPRHRNEYAILRSGCSVIERIRLCEIRELLKESGRCYRMAWVIAGLRDGGYAAHDGAHFYNLSHPDGVKYAAMDMASCMLGDG